MSFEFAWNCLRCSRPAGNLPSDRFPRKSTWRKIRTYLLCAAHPKWRERSNCDSFRVFVATPTVVSSLSCEAECRACMNHCVAWHMNQSRQASEMRLDEPDWSKLNNLTLSVAGLRLGQTIENLQCYCALTCVSSGCVSSGAILIGECVRPLILLPAHILFCGCVIGSDFSRAIRHPYISEPEL